MNIFILSNLATLEIIMPKIFEYLGIILFSYSNEHEPIHVHANHGEFESKAEFTSLMERYQK